MAEAGRINDHRSGLAVHGLSLFECCCCNSSKHDAVQLNCLHYYCRSCFHSSSNTTQELRSVVTCPTCSEVTEISTVPTNSVLSTYKRVSALRAQIVWCNTCEKNAKEEAGEIWCVDCEEVLCYKCYERHNEFIGGHRIFELEYARSLRWSQLTRPVLCNLHNQPIEAYCFACCFPKCTKCCESCTAASHDFRPQSDEKYQKHVSSVVNRVRDNAEQLSDLLPSIQQKCRAIKSRLEADRGEGRKMLVTHRQRLYESSSRAFDVSVDEVCVHLQSARFERPDVLTRDIPLSCSANIEALDFSGVQNLQLLGVRNLLKVMTACCCSSGRNSIVRILQSYAECGSMNIRGSVSLTSDIVLSACLGATDRWRAAPSAPLLFSNNVVRFVTPVTCFDLAATQDGHVLLAAGERGLLMYSNRGQQLSSWRPARRSKRNDDWVYCVAELSDRRAAVGVVWAQLVVLLKLSQPGNTWLENGSVAVLLSPHRLAVHGDLLAAVDLRRDKQQQLGLVKLLRLSSRQVLYAQSRDYVIHQVALTALCVVTASDGRVKCNSGTRPYMLDAFSHSGQFLWRYETGDQELVAGLCVSADTGSRVYVTVRMKDWSSSRVIAVGGADGRNSTEVLSSQTHLPQQPSFLSLARGQQRTVVATWSDIGGGTVWLYEATG